MSKLNTVVKKLEDSLIESNENDKQMLAKIHNDTLQHQRLVAQLEEAQKENKELLSTNPRVYWNKNIIKTLIALDVLQQQYNDGDLSRSTSRSQIDISSTYSTVSMVHLQYKYE